MPSIMVILLFYALFLLSGAAGLVYEVAWVRSLSLVFGGSHVAVTTVLSVFMGGLALGGWIIGRRSDAWSRPQRLYGLMEIAVALSALGSVVLIRMYPIVYVPLVRGAQDRPLLLACLRVLFAAAALALPATLMGGTLPVLSRLVRRSADGVSRHLSFLYGCNTLGAAAGALTAGFVLLRHFGTFKTVLLAAAVNAAIGLVAIVLPERACEPAPGIVPRTDRSRSRRRFLLAKLAEGFSSRPILWGIGVSGFCALGYEVLWTRMLSLVVGTSVYSFTIMLVAFLAGIALGSQAYGLASGILSTRGRRNRGRPALGNSGARKVANGGMLAFSVTQAAIAASALSVTYGLRDLPSNAARAQNLLLGTALGEFGARQRASFLLAFAYMLVPAFFMGVAFPLAAGIHAARAGRVGSAVGGVLFANTIGAIAGAAAGGFVLIPLFGIERALLLLCAVNAGTALVTASSLSRRTTIRLAAASAGAAVLLAVALAPGELSLWNRTYFAIYRNNQRDAFDTPARIADALEHTGVLYHFEGANETISVIRPEGGDQALLVDGRVEASTTRADRQCQYALGHIPMLLHPQPRRVFVLGLGTGMTLGAASAHPEGERLTLAEIEPGVLPAARAFALWNHSVLDDPRLRIVRGDGRNMLWTTSERFDVITADPIHPWSGGAAYLYTTECFRAVSEHLGPGGIACQWLPIYELSVDDLKSIVRTFTESFSHAMLWMTHYDAELIGSNAPIVLDESALARRMARTAVQADLAEIEMGSATDLLGYFVMGTDPLRRFGEGAPANTDDNLHLEFSAPRSMGMGQLPAENVAALTARRESVARYLRPAPAPLPAAARLRAHLDPAVARAYDRAHALFLLGDWRTDEFQALMSDLRRRAPDYAPFRFLAREYRDELARTPALLEAASFAVRDAEGRRRIVEISAVAMRVGEARAAVILVDNAAREIYGQLYLDGAEAALDARARDFASETLAALREAYGRESALLAGGPPPAESMLRRFRLLVADKVRARSPLKNAR